MRRLPECTVTALLIALAIAAAAAVAWWLSRTRARPAPEPGPPDDLFPPPFTGEIHYEFHALLRRGQRGISDANVREALGGPISVTPTKREGKWRKEVRGRTDVRVLRVIVVDWPVDRPRIITVIWEDKEVIEVPTNRLNALFGKGGKTIKGIQAESGTKVLVHKDRSGEQTKVTIQSMFEPDRYEAKAAIAKVVG